jgi:protease-4
MPQAGHDGQGPRLACKLRFWRILGVLALAGLALAALGSAGAFEGLTQRGRDHIARVRVAGMITSDRSMIDLLAGLARKDSVRAVILDISTPGGTTAGGEAIYEAVRALGAVKPVVASVDTLAASAGYMIACGADRIVARRSSIVGSIGVLFQYGDVSALLDRLGVKVDAVKSSPLKAEPSPFKPASEESKAMLGRVVADSYDWFVSLVAERRKLEPQKARALADGSIFTGAQGLANGLVDELGDETAAQKWLEKEKSVPAGLPILEWKPARKPGFIPFLSAAPALLRLFGIEAGEREAAELANLLERRAFVDGLLSLMQTGTTSQLQGSGNGAK